MKLLLTSAGISNTSIRNALIDLLGKPIAESSALFIPTAIYAIPNGQFRIKPLPLQTQAAPVFGITAEDIDGDGNLDLLMVGNDYGMDPTPEEWMHLTDCT